MAKKSSKKKSAVSKELGVVYSRYKGSISSMIIDFVESKFKDIVGIVKDYSNLKKKIQKLIIVDIVMFLGVFFALFGVAKYLSTVVPGLQNGLEFLVLGAFLLFVAVVYKNI
jgi:hypothetical protein